MGQDLLNEDKDSQIDQTVQVTNRIRKVAIAYNGHGAMLYFTLLHWLHEMNSVCYMLMLISLGFPCRSLESQKQLLCYHPNIFYFPTYSFLKNNAMATAHHLV